MITSLAKYLLIWFGVGSALGFIVAVFYDIVKTTLSAIRNRRKAKDKNNKIICKCSSDKEAVILEKNNSKIYSIFEIKNMLYPVFSSAPVYKATLFGSYAKGKADSLSDVDIVIDSHGELVNINFYGVLGDITDALGKKVDLLEVCEIEKDSSIYREIQKQGVVLYER